MFQKLIDKIHTLWTQWKLERAIRARWRKVMAASVDDMIINGYKEDNQ